MKIPEKVSILWWENEKHKRFDTHQRVEGKIRCQITRHAALIYNYMGRGENGSRLRMEKAINLALVDALVKSQGWLPSQAVLVVGIACERCIGVLLDLCGLPGGFKENSSNWQKFDTKCEFCSD